MGHSKDRAAGGFSLVELMVVISIIGLLASIVAINASGVGESAKRKKVIADVSSLDSAIQIYRLEMNHWPQQLSDLLGGPHGAYITNGAKALLDPWDHPYVYQLEGEGDPPYRLGSYGADGQPGGDKENADLFPHEAGAR